MRLLVVNIFFEPQSFGGATVVAERMAETLYQDHGWEVFSVAARFAPLPSTSLIRYKTKSGFDGFNIGIPMPAGGDYNIHFKNEQFIEPFCRVLDYVNPDVVHVHCVQDIGANFFDILVDRSIPFVVTIHDFWWLCERQFMIDIKGEYCGQKRIDYAKCAVCSGERARVENRAEYLKSQLAKADAILAVSQFTKDMLIANGLPADKIVVNKNGIVPPSANFTPRKISRFEKEPTVFGFVGGPGPIKGWDLIVEAFSPLAKDSYRILAVDAGATVGHSWKSDLLRTGGHLSMEVIPGYGFETIDPTFGQFDVLLAPSMWKETFGLTAREALVRDVWVIAPDAGGLAEDIVDGKNGNVLSFPPTTEELRTAISEQIESRSSSKFDKSNITLANDQAEELNGILTDTMK